MTWSKTGEVTKDPKGMVIVNGVYEPMDDVSATDTDAQKTEQTADKAAAEEGAGAEETAK
jgi:hypothetical protein